MKRDYLAILPVASIVLLVSVAIIKPFPKAEKPQEVATIDTNEVFETETMKTMEQFIREQAQIQNDLVLANVEALHKSEIEATSEESETEEETTTEEYVEPVWTAYDFLPLSEEVQKGIKAACDEYEVSFDLVIAICKQESSLNPLCVSGNGIAYGLGQIMPKYWEETAFSLGLYDYKTDAVQNATMVCYIIGRQLNTYHHTMQEALNIYRHGVMDDKVEPDGETYYQKILRNLEWLQNGGN